MKYDSDVFTLFQVKPSHARRFVVPSHTEHDTGQDVFSLLPLAMRINNEVLVLHGGNCHLCACSSAFIIPPFPGLCRSGVATLEQLKAIDRRRPVPVSTADPADVLFFDTMWAGDTSLPDSKVHT